MEQALPKREGDGQARPKSKGRVRRDPNPQERMGRLTILIVVLFQNWSFVAPGGFQKLLNFEFEI